MGLTSWRKVRCSSHPQNHGSSCTSCDRNLEFGFGLIAGAIARLLDNSQMALAYGEAGRQRIIREFSIDRMLRQTEALYMRLAEND